MTASVLICLAPGSEGTEAVTTFDLLVRDGIAVTEASVASDGATTVTCSRGARLVADAPLVSVADNPFNAIVLPAVSKEQNAFATARYWWNVFAKSIRKGKSWPPSVPFLHWCWNTTSCFQSAT